MRNGHFITDYHCHSTVSPDGHNTMREMAEAAVRLGVDDLCFTDHIEPLPWDRWNEPPREKHSYDWAPMLAQFREAQEAVGDRIKLHMGTELGECSFAPDVADSFLDDAPPLDFPTTRSWSSKSRGSSGSDSSSRTPITRTTPMSPCRNSWG